MPFTITYRKSKDKSLLSSLAETTGLLSPQNYNPIHELFFDMTSSNARNVVFATPENITGIKTKHGDTHYTITITDGNKLTRDTDAFVKFSPVLDPLKHISGCYTSEDIEGLPRFGGESHTHPKATRTTNSSYIDMLCSLLTTHLNATTGIPNFLKFYGSFIGVKKNYRYMITDDIDDAYESNFFTNNLGSKFVLEGVFPFRKDTLSVKPQIKMGNLCSLGDIESSILHNDIFASQQSTLNTTTPGVIELIKASALDSEPSDSEASDTESDESLTRESYSDNSDITDDDSYVEEDAFCRIDKFPCSAIFLEKLEATLESLITESSPSDKEWASALFQTVASLAALQKTIDFTHNDLHTSNVMWTHTDQPFLCYKIGGKYYKVPTFGKIFKIIDFGRSIFTYNGTIFASDSFEKGEDADGQYNCEPFYDHNKPIVMPNKSFDLCRLGCSLFDFFFHSPPKDTSNLSDLEKLVMRWCQDEQGKNILYKTTGEERYPGFKLYKMIARRVTGLEPHNVLTNEPLFTQFQCSKEKLNKLHIHNIDDLSCLVQKSGSFVKTPTV